MKTTYYKGRGNHTIHELEELVEHFKEEAYRAFPKDGKTKEVKGYMTQESLDEITGKVPPAFETDDPSAVVWKSPDGECGATIPVTLIIEVPEKKVEITESQSGTDGLYVSHRILKEKLFGKDGE